MSKPGDGSKLEGHSYDGIEELDNSLPNWWLGSLYLTIAFAFVYFIYYSVMNGPTLINEYDQDKTAHQALLDAQKKNDKTPSEDELRGYLKDTTRLKSGGEVYQSKCVACHGAKGQGGIGPNLTDDYWIHGSKMTEIAKSVTNGVPEKGMPPWGPVLTTNELYSVVTFVKSLKGTHPSDGKAPQGDLVKE